MTNKKHSRFSPSSAYRWLKCAASANACASIEGTTSDYAEEGTAAASLAEVILRTELPSSAFVGQTADNGVEWTAEMAEHVQLYLDTIQNDLEAYGGDQGFEYHCDVSYVHPELEGTADAALYSPRIHTLRIYDLKYGAGVYVPADTPQLKIYALGALAQIERQRTDTKEGGIQHIELIIVQPRVHVDDEEDLVRRHSMTRAELIEWRDSELIPGISAADDMFARFTPSKAACRWCDAANQCDAFKELGQEAAREVFQQLPRVMSGESKQDPSTLGLGRLASAMTPERLAQALGQLEILELWISTLRKHAMARACNGEKVPGFKVVRKVGNRRWRSDLTEEHVVGLMKSQLEFSTQDCYAERKLVSPAQAEKIATKDKKPTIASMVEKPLRDKILVPEADKRPACDVGPEAVFKEIQSEQTKR